MSSETKLLNQEELEKVAGGKPKEKTWEVPDKAWLDYIANKAIQIYYSEHGEFSRSKFEAWLRHPMILEAAIENDMKIISLDEVVEYCIKALYQQIGYQAIQP